LKWDARHLAGIEVPSCLTDLGRYHLGGERRDQRDVSNGAEVRTGILGHIAAHETGHLLLGTNSHAPRGIMRAMWLREELASASKGALFFSGSESRQMKEKLAMTAVPRNEAMRAAAEQLGD